MEADAVHIDLDGAWPPDLLPDTVDLRAWGPRLRFSAPTREVEAFYAAAAPRLRPFIVYGSGDFHHLSALWLRQLARPVTLVSFDNHPDWDIRPPAWCCGSWINRALELRHVEQVGIWGCGNFECWGWQRMTGNHGDVKSGRLIVHPWADNRPARDREKPNSITQATWRGKFQEFAQKLAGRQLYVTVDMDCLRSGESATNWENGFFSVEDVTWALATLKAHATVAAGDLCGAYSPQAYARWKQCFAANTDHPRLAEVMPEEARRINLAAFRAIWPCLTA